MKMKMKDIQRETIKHIMSYHCDINSITLEWLRNDSEYNYYKNGYYFDEDMSKKQFDIKFKNHIYEEDSFNENDLNEVIAEFKETLKKLEKIRREI